MLTLGDADAVEQLRSALAVGCTAATLVAGRGVDVRPRRRGPRDRRRRPRPRGRGPHPRPGPARQRRRGQRRLPGRDPAGLRAGPPGRERRQGGLGRRDGTVTARVEGPDGVETYRVPLPAVVTIREGGVEPRYPSVPGRMKAKKVPVEERAPTAEPTGPEAGQAAAAPAGAQQRADPRQGPRGGAGRRRPARGAGGAEPDDPGPGREDRRRRRRRGVARGADLRAQPVRRRAAASPSTRSSSGEVLRRAAQGRWRRTASATVHQVGRRGRRGVLRRGLGLGDPVGAAQQAKSVVVMAAGTDRGNELMAHVAARAGVAMAANVLSFDGLAPFVVTRQVVGGAALEEMLLDRAPGGVLGGRPRGRGRTRPTPGRGRRRRAHPGDRRGRPGRARRLRSSSPRPTSPGRSSPPASSSAPAAAPAARTGSATCWS